MIRWGSSSFRPSNGQGQGINPPRRQNILQPLKDKTPEGLVWGSVIMNVLKEEGEVPSVTPSPTPTSTLTPTPSSTQGLTPTPTPTQTGTPTLTPTQTSTSTPTPTVTQTGTPTSTPTPTASPSVVSELDYIVYAEDSVDRSTYTFSNVNYGGAGLIIVGIHAWDDPGNQSLGTPTISGFNMTQVVSTAAVSGTPVRFMSALYSYRMTGGTSANIVVPFTNTIQFCSISVWRLTNNISDTAFDTDSSAIIGTVSSNTVTLNLNTGRNHIVSIDTRKQGTSTSTWTNATEQYDFQQESNGVATGAEGFYVGSGSAAIIMNGSGDLNAMVGAVWN